MVVERKLVRICALALAVYCQKSTNRHRTEDMLHQADLFLDYINGRT